MSGKVAVQCDWCGNEVLRYPSQIGEHVFCCTECRSRFQSKKHNPDGYTRHPHLSEFNQKANVTRMTPEIREKLRQSRLGAGQGNSYEKTYGRHTHRVVAEEMLGRPLLPNEVVHHIDGNKRNNKPENLMVFASQEEHAAWHVKEEKLFYGTVMGQEVTPK